MRRLLALALVAGSIVGCAPDEPRAITPAQQTLRWERLAPVPTPRTEVTATARRGKIFVVGGKADDQLPAIAVVDMTTFLPFLTL